MSPVTMTTVARAAGVAPSTVSKALRNDPSIGAATRRRLQQLARRLGYRPHPLVSTLMAQLHGTRRQTDPCHLAWLDLWQDRSGPSARAFGEQLLVGARRRAAELGYQIERYSPSLQSLGPSALRRMLLARGQRGLILPSLHDTPVDFPLDLRGLTAVAIGTCLRSPRLHRVAPDLHQGCILAFARLTGMGCTRIGLLLSPDLPDRVERRWLAAYLAEQFHLPVPRRLPPLLVPDAAGSEITRWLAHYEPDALLVGDPGMAAWPGVRERAAAGRLQVASLRLGAGSHELRGVDYQAERQGRLGVELLVRLIHRNESGLPDHAETTLVDPVWVDVPVCAGVGPAANPTTPDADEPYRDACVSPLPGEVWPTSHPASLSGI